MNCFAPRQRTTASRQHRRLLMLADKRWRWWLRNDDLVLFVCRPLDVATTNGPTEICHPSSCRFISFPQHPSVPGRSPSSSSSPPHPPRNKPLSPNRLRRRGALLCTRASRVYTDGMAETHSWRRKLGQPLPSSLSWCIRALNILHRLSIRRRCVCKRICTTGHYIIDVLKYY